jgi:glutathione S-transferase
MPGADANKVRHAFDQPAATSVKLIQVCGLVQQHTEVLEQRVFGLAVVRDVPAAEVDVPIAGSAFTVADITMAGVLRSIRKTDLMAPFPRLSAYYERCHARPAWQRTLALSAQRLGMTVDEIR